MATFINSFIRSKKVGGTKEQTKKTLKTRVYVPESIYNRKNWIICSLGLGGIIFWLFMPTTPENQIIPYTFSPAITLWLQKLLGTDGLFAWVSSIYYNFPMMTNVALFFVVTYFAPRGKARRESWIYGLAILLIGLADSLIYLIFPVAPPIRVPDHLVQGVEQIRINLLPWSDKLITLKYCAFPSGHVFYSIMGYLVSRAEGFTKMSRFYLTNTSVFSIIILYLGEHYWFDIVGSVVLALGVFFFVTSYFDKKYTTRSLDLLYKTENLFSAKNDSFASNSSNNSQSTKIDMIQVSTFQRKFL